MFEKSVSLNPEYNDSYIELLKLLEEEDDKAKLTLYQEMYNNLIRRN